MPVTTEARHRQLTSLSYRVVEMRALFVPFFPSYVCSSRMREGDKGHPAYDGFFTQLV